MNKKELKNKLDKLQINSNLYSLNNELLPDRLVLYNSYLEWHVFYFDERGNRNDEIIFNSEEEACEHIYQILLKETKQKV